MSNLIFMEGFDAYNGTGVNVGAASRGWSIGANFTMQAGRFGGQCLQGVNTGTGAPTTMSPPWSSSVSQFAFGCAVWYNYGSINGISTQIGFSTASTWQIGLHFNTNGSIDVYRITSQTAGTLLGSTAAGVILNSTFQYLEVECVISDTVGRVTLYIDSVQVLNITGADTNNSGGVVDRVQFFGAGSGFSNAMKFDDIYVVDAATKLGERRIDLLLPTSDSAVQFTRSTGATNFSLVDEGAGANSDTDYVQSANVNDADIYGFADLSVTPASIDGVRLIAFAEKTDVGQRALALQLKSGGATDTSTDFNLAAAYGYVGKTYQYDPNGAIAWTALAVNSLTAGYKVSL
jgi:hypothetical protein